jgi:hypothetical protein
MKQSCIRAGDIRILEQQQLVTAVRPRMDLDSGVQKLYGKLLKSTFICMKPQAHIMSEPVAIIILVQRSFSSNGATTPYFSPLDHVAC